MSILEFCNVGAEEAAQPDKTLTFDLADVRRCHPEAVVAFRVFELESELGGWVADSTEGCQARAPKPHNYIDHEVVRSAAEAHIAGTHPIDSWLVSLTLWTHDGPFSIQLGLLF